MWWMLSTSMARDRRHLVRLHVILSCVRSDTGKLSVSEALMSWGAMNEDQLIRLAIMSSWHRACARSARPGSSFVVVFIDEDNV